MRTLLEKLFVVVALLYLSGAILPLLPTESSAPGSSSTFLFAVQTSIYLTMCVFLLLRGKQFVALSSRLTWILALLLFAELSTFWSTIPELTWRRAIVVALTSTFGVYFSLRYSMREQLKLLATMFAISALLSIVVSTLLPQYGVMHEIHEGDWAGVFGHKNTFGRIMALSGVVFALSASVFKKQRTINCAGFLVSGALVWLSGSKTALVAVTVLSALLHVYRAGRFSMKTLVPLAIFSSAIMIGACAFALSYKSELLQMLGRDETLTGRTQLWTVVAMAIANKPWLGYGLNGFWAGFQGAAADVVTSVRWKAVHAHSGILDLCLDLGLIGASVFMIGFFIAFRDAIRVFRRRPESEMVWPLMYLSFLFLYNLTESTILRPNNLFWALYVSSAANLARLARETAIHNSVAIQHLGNSTRQVSL